MIRLISSLSCSSTSGSIAVTSAGVRTPSATASSNNLGNNKFLSTIPASSHLAIAARETGISNRESPTAIRFQGNPSGESNRTAASDEIVTRQLHISAFCLGSNVTLAVSLSPRRTRICIITSSSIPLALSRASRNKAPPASPEIGRRNRENRISASMRSEAGILRREKACPVSEIIVTNRA